MSFALLSKTGQYLSWQLRRGWAALNHWHLLGIGSLVFASSLYLLVIQPLQLQTQQLQERLQHAKSQLAQRPAARSALPVPRNRRQAFLDFLPAQHQREQALALMHRLAQQQDLQLGRVDYQTRVLPELPVEQLRLRFTLHGPEAQVLAFINNSLHLLPSLAYVRLDQRRENGNLSAITLQVEANLYTRLERLP